MKALSIRQPWAWAIIHAGKPVENRDWQDDGPNMRMARRLQNSDIAIHAGKRLTSNDYLDYLETAQSTLPPRDVMHTPGRGGFQLGGIVAVARFVGIVRESIQQYDTRPELNAARQSPWFFGPYGLALANVRKTKFAAINGALGFFDVPDSIIQFDLSAAEKPESPGTVAVADVVAAGPGVEVRDGP